MLLENLMSRKTYTILFIYTPLTLWWSAMFIATSIPGEAIPPVPAFNYDKLIHAFMYGGLTLFFYRFIRCREKLFAPPLIITFVTIAFYGAFDEWHQQFVGRTPSLYDYYANLAGVILVTFATVIIKLFKRISG